MCHASRKTAIYFIACIVTVVSLATPVYAHRLDEYLQATTLSLAKDHIEIRMRLTPGVAVFDEVLKSIDINSDGAISSNEQQTYADRVARDVACSYDGTPLPLHLISFTFPSVEDMKQGMGDILLVYQTSVPAGGTDRRLVFENHHQREISAYLMNCLVPRDPDIHITAQDRNIDQSSYTLIYSQTQSHSGPTSVNLSEHMGSDATGNRSIFKAYVFLGIHHILTGYDHLLFVSALVLAATTLWDLIKVVSTFTLAHTITLTLAALNIVHLSERIVEPLISASIVFIAIQNVFWPTRARGWSRVGAAFFFGLFHGLGFAGGLLEAMREMQSSTMLLAIFAFSLGVETGHQMVVLPLFAFLEGARATRANPVSRARLAMAFQRVGSAGISMAGMYYLCVAFKS